MEGTMEEWKQFVAPAVLEAARSVVKLSGDECQWFTAMSGGLHGSPYPGPSQIVLYLPSRKNARIVTGQQCRDGRFSMVTLTATNLQPSPALDRRVRNALAKAPNTLSSHNFPLPRGRAEA